VTVALAQNWTARRGLLGAATVLAFALVWAVPPRNLLAAVLATVGGLAVLRYPTVGFCLLGLSVPWGSPYTVSAGSFPITPTDLLVGLLGFAWLIRIVTWRVNPFVEAPWIGYVGIFLGAIMLSTSQAADLPASAREVVKWLELATVYLAGTTFIRSGRQVQVIIAAVVAGGVSQALLGFAQTGLSLGPAAFAAQRLALRAYGTFDQPNPYAGYLNLVIPLALAMVLVGPRGRQRVWYALSTLLMVAAVLASESRGALLAGFVAISMMLALTYRGFLAAAFLGVLSLIGGSLLAVYNFLPLSEFDRFLTPLGLANVTFSNVNDANFSAVERAAHWLAGVRMFAAHPLLGVGIGNYSAAYPAYHPRGWYASLDHAHDYFINIAAESGIVGLTAYVLLVGSALWYSFVALRRSREPIFRAAGLGVTGALVATSFHNIFDVLFVHSITTLLGLLMALVAVPFLSPEASGTSDARATVPSWRRSP
jgi:O-antigen ligase